MTKNEEKKDDCAGLTHQPIPDMAGTEPRLNNYGAPLAVAIEDGALVIRIGIQTLAHAVTYSDWAHQYDDEACDYFRDFAISDAHQFAVDVGNMMQREEEDGSSLLTNFIDKASLDAVGDGSLGIHEDKQRIKHGEKSTLEAW